MSKLTLFFLFLWSTFIGAYIGKSQGLKQASKDIELASFKLKQCQEVITR